jgi:hypothetical protein
MLDSISSITQLAKHELSGSHNLIRDVLLLCLLAVVIWVVASACVGAYRRERRDSDH